MVLRRDHHLSASPATVNRCLHRHQRIDPKISARNQPAWAEKKLRESGSVPLVITDRPPRQRKADAPGALMEKDMQFVPTTAKIPRTVDAQYHLQDFFNDQHSLIDSCTRSKALELVAAPESHQATAASALLQHRLPCAVGAIKTDSGGENGKDGKRQLADDAVVHCFSRTGTPTDNPRVERSRRTDEKEFYSRGKRFLPCHEQPEALKPWEYMYNAIRPHQALGYLTPKGILSALEKGSATGERDQQ